MPVEGIWAEIEERKKEAEKVIIVKVKEGGEASWLWDITAQ